MYEVIKENAGAFVNLLKETGCYSIVAKDSVTEVAGDDDTETEDAIENTYGNEEE